MDALKTITLLRHRLLPMALLALAYGLSGWLSLQLAIPPDYVSLVFLPAGISMGCALVFGAWVLPGVFLGSLAVQLIASAQAGIPGWSWTLLISPAGAVLQAWFGAWLARRLTQYPCPMDTPASVIRLLLGCAPLSGLINASMSVPALVFSGVIPADEALFSWWTWWLGDAVGMVICLPLVLVFLGQPADQWRTRRRAVAIPLLLAMLLGGIGFTQIRAWENQRLIDQLSKEAQEKANLVQRRLDAQNDSVLAVSHLMQVMGQMNQATFAGAVQPWLNRYTGTQNFGWSPRIEQAQRALYERAHFRIQGRQPTGDTYAAPAKGEYFPITLIEPLRSNQPVLGLDITVLPATAATVKASQDSGQPAVSEAIRLVQESGEQRGVVLYQAVYDSAERLRVKGVVSAVFRMDDVMEAALGTSAPQRLAVCLVDTAAQPGNRRLSGPVGCDAESWLRAGLHQRRVVHFGARDWELRLRAGDGFFAEARNWSAWSTLASTLVAIGMLGAFLLVMTGHAHRTQALVALRTLELAQLAHFDSLTGLPNRSHWLGRAQTALQAAQRHGDALVVVFLDLDHFKHVNDTLGHDQGDQLLKTVAERLLPCLRSEDLLARLGGDEFVALLPRIRSNDDAAAVAEKLLAALIEPMHLREQEITLSVSLGLACYPEDGDTVETLLKHADTAMYAAKEAGRNGYQFFRAEMNARVSQRMFVENSLRRALERQELFLVFQPQVDARSGQLISAEALVRWRHPERGLIPPGQFIPIAEDSGLIEPLGDWVLRQACLQLKAWREQGLHSLMVAVNISALQFRKPGFVRAVRQVLADTGVNPWQIELEITETLLMQPLPEIDQRLRELADLGLSFALDDFGTGYSNLGYLKRLPISRLKLDKSFVADLPGDTGDEAVARAAISMAKDLGLDCVAEGVETPAQRDLLAALGCTYLQGFLVAYPMVADDFWAWHGTQALLAVAAPQPAGAATPA